jgi:predicted Zn-dependent protease
VNRREAIVAGCAGCACLALRASWAQERQAYIMPRRLSRPEAATDEGGLWAAMDREERVLRRSPLVVRDERLHRYVQDIACRLAGEHCPDIRVMIVRTPLFNASMAPNGAMQVWTGLLLRMENEAQLAAVIGHEIGHYVQRHSVDRLRDIKAKAAVGQVLGLFGLAGAVGQIAVAASTMAYGRDHEREADMVGAELMHRAGYDVGEAARVWANLLRETEARDAPTADRILGTLFATHPAPPERQAALEQTARLLPGGQAHGAAYAGRIGGFVGEWLHDEVKRGQYAEALVLLSRHLDRGFMPELMAYHRGEVYRLRGQAGDQDLALADYRLAAGSGNPHPPAFRGIGLILRQRGERAEAATALSRYLQLAPDAPDTEFIKAYVAELTS